MQQAMIKAPDLLATVASLLEPHELQRMRCVSKGMYKAITKEIMLQCIQSTFARYAGPHAMPDGTIRFYSTFGQRTYDICKIQSGYQLKQEGCQVQVFERMQRVDTVAKFNANSSAIELDTVLNDSSSRLKTISKYVLDMRDTTTLGFEVKPKDTGPPISMFAMFTLKLPAGSRSSKDSETEQIFFQCFEFYINRLYAKMPTLQRA